MFSGTLLFLFLVIASVAHADETISFNRDVRPILSDACFYCHGPDAEHRQADLRLDMEQDAKAYAIVPGELSNEFIQRIIHDDPGMRMPPPESGKQLTADQIALLKRWVTEGAAYEPYWAYVPPRLHPAPIVDSNWPRQWVDRFIFQRLNKKQLVPAPDADRVTLIRRLCFDLTGTPPTPAEVASFVSDTDPLAYQRLVDRLLASPAFGQRMASYWLDLVRFADTVGYHGDQPHNISPYRDYVIDAINDDKGLDQFTIEQLAGDLLPEPTIDQRIATGYNRLLQTSHEGGVQPKEYLAIYAADRVRNLSSVWMGATVGCAQCHDHKYDPYTIADFYSLAAFFADIDEAQHLTNGSNALPTKRAPEIAVLSRWERERLAEIDALIESADDQQREQLRAERNALNQRERLVMVTQSIEPRKMRVLPRGNWLDDSGPIVEPAVPDFLGSMEVTERRPNRLDLARWLVDPDQGIGGLTARVFVNRYWYLLFGRGISSSLADFGGQGQPPTHPELLDRLAIALMADGWSVKRLIRRLVLSRTYRQSSVASGSVLAADPNNEWFARQSRYRLPAEMVRDTVLTIGGLLVNQVGGSSVKPVQPAGYYRHLNFPRRSYVPDRGSQQYRRGVYVHWQRQFLHPMLRAADAPRREECTAQRPRSNTPLEALVMLNDPTMVEAAVGLARRLTRISGDRQRIDEAFRIAVSRPPSDTEATELEKLVAAERAYYRQHTDQAEAFVGDRSDSDAGTELAAWTSVARAILNMYETVSRN